MNKCFNCGATLGLKSLKCPECGYMPDVEFMRSCPNLKGAICLVENKMCKNMGPYQTCLVKNMADSECGY